MSDEFVEWLGQCSDYRSMMSTDLSDRNLEIYHITAWRSAEALVDKIEI